MSEKKPVVSIIVPNFNKSSFILETLKSLKKQTYKHWEAIIIDDHSTDDSIQIIQKFQSTCNNIKLIIPERENAGASHCRNLGIKNSNGEFIIFLDSDDILTPKCIQSRINAYLKAPKYDFIVFPCGTFSHKIGDSKSIWVPKSNDFLISFLKHEIKWTICSVLWKKSALIYLKGFKEDYKRLQDVELHTRAILSKKLKFKTYPKYEVDNYYRISNDRKLVADEVFLNNYMSGTFLYISDMSNKLYTKAQKQALKGTLFTLMNNINFYYITKKINQQI